MAKAHLYVRLQVEGPNKAIKAIDAAGKALWKSVLDAGGEWRGSVQIELDDEPMPAPVVYESKPDISKEKIIRR